MAVPIRLVIMGADTTDGGGSRQYLTKPIFLSSPLTRVGAGRHAVVFAADSDQKRALDPSTCRRAVKFLREEKDGEEYNAELRARFFSEISSLHYCHERESGQRGQSGLVEYLGFGLLSKCTAECEKRAKEIGHPNDPIALANTIQDVVAFHGLAGVFYAMDRASCSLDAFLYLDSPVSLVKSGGSHTSWKTATKSRDGGPYSWFDFTFCFQLFRQAVSAVWSFHKNEGNYAHRDIKPGNFLVFVDQAGSLLLKLSDFGGLSSGGIPVGGTTDVQLSESTNRRSSLMNQPGSRGYRSPEQRETGLSVLVRVEVRPQGGGLHVHVVERDFEVSIAKGDTLVLSEPFLGARDLVVEDVVGEGADSYGVVGLPLLEEPPDKTLPAEIQATLYRNQGKAADAFALGCLLYHLGSGGRDAEQFLYSVLSWALQASPSEDMSCGEIASILYAGSDRDLEQELLQVESAFSGARGFFFGDATEGGGSLLQRVRKARSDAGINAQDPTLVALSECLNQVTERCCDGKDSFIRGRTCKLTPEMVDHAKKVASCASAPRKPEMPRTTRLMLSALSRDEYVGSRFLVDKADKPIPWSVLAMTFCLTLRGYKASVAERSVSAIDLSRVRDASDKLALAARSLFETLAIDWDKTKGKKPEGDALVHYARARLDLRD